MQEAKWFSQDFSSPASQSGCTTAVEVAAELREVDGGSSGGGTIEAQVSGCDRLPGLLHTRERGEDLLFRNGGEPRG